MRLLLCGAFVVTAVCLMCIDISYYQPLLSAPPQAATFFDKVILFLGQNFQYSNLVQIFLLLGLSTVLIGECFSEPLGGTIKEELQNFTQTSANSATKLTDGIIKHLSAIQSSVDAQMKSISSTLTGNRDETVRAIVDDWIMRSSEPPMVYKEHGLKALYRYYGSHCKNNESFFSFVQQQLLEPWAKQGSVFCKDQSTTIAIRTPVAPRERSLNGRGLLMWEETRDFKYEFHKPLSEIETGNEPQVELVHYAIQRVPFGLLDDFLAYHMAECSFDNNLVFSLSRTLAETPDAKDRLKKGEKVVTDTVCLEYGNDHFSFRYCEKMRLVKNSTTVSMKELGFIDPSVEDHYFLRLRKPTKGVKVHVFISPATNCVLQAYATGVEWKCRPEEPRGTSGQMFFECEGWVMPGLAFSFIWGSPVEGLEQFRGDAIAAPH